VKTWECFQATRKVGRTRQKLAAMIEEALPGITLYPEDLQPQNPAFSRPEVDACTWDAWGERNGQKVHFYSWCSMGRIVKAGKLKATQDDSPNNYEIDPYEPR
jgi:hypothetical protein